MKIALVGNPNSGKTTVYNALTGRNETVGNRAGVTVEKKCALIKKLYAGETEITAVDLPGAYSMSAYTAEEHITGNYIKEEAPDVIINIVDASNLSRSLFFTTQLLELGIPMVIALNKTDINKKKGTRIDCAALSRLLCCPVAETVSTRSQGLGELVALAAGRVGTRQLSPFPELADLPQGKAADKKRFALVKKLVTQVETRKVLTKDRNAQDRVDMLLTHPAAGIPIFAAVMFLVFQISQSWLGPVLADGYTFENGFTIPGLVTLIDGFKEQVIFLLEQADANPFLTALLTEGIIGGVSAVVGFLPLVMVLYFLLSLLEDCGYMARATVVLDPLFKKVGLSGKAVIPFIVGTGCAVPGIMAARTIPNQNERNAAVMLTPFMPCGAKLPVIALFAGAFFKDASWVGTMMYFAGILLILLCALLVNRIAGNDPKGSYFIIELPEYKLPDMKRAFRDMCSRGGEYILKAGTVILLCNAVVFMMQSFDLSLQPVAEGMADTSILARIAAPVAALLVPILGVAAWQMAAATVTGFIAKENVVGTLAVCYGISNLIDTEGLEMLEGAGTQVAAVFGITRAAALAFLMFNLFSPPCFAAIGAMNAELKDKRWLFGGIALQLSVAYTISFLVYQVGTLLTTGSVGAGFTGGSIAVLVIATILTILCMRRTKA